MHYMGIKEVLGINKSTKSHRAQCMIFPITTLYDTTLPIISPLNVAVDARPTLRELVSC